MDALVLAAPPEGLQGPSARHLFFYEGVCFITLEDYYYSHYYYSDH